VRTEREFANGHPAGAVNIPVAFPDPARGMMANPDFVSVVEKNFSKDKKSSLVARPVRDHRRITMLEQAGFQDISNMLGGFGGMRDQTGTVVAPGWAASGLPVSSDNGEGVSYASLAAKAR
jgi:rhodanese-related sulfurtransferase